MANEFRTLPSHSAEYFGDTRDYWWNPDFLALIAERLMFDRVREALDVGCGVGHWTYLIAGLLRSDARLCGVDRDPAWVENASARIAARGLAERIDFKAASAESLPFPDDSFDLVTCQTLLIHVSDPAAVIAEMCRVARPGGLVLACEPNNVSRALLFNSMSAQDPVEAVLALVRFQLLCERGKAALGEGNNSIGDLVPESVQRRRTGRSQRLPQRQGEPARAALRHTRAARHGGRAGRLQRSRVLDMEPRRYATLLPGGGRV